MIRAEVELPRPQPTVSPEIGNYVEQARPLVEKMLAEAPKYSFQEYLALGTQQALEALSEGTYGIGAMYVYRQSGREVVIAGRNGMVNKKDTHLHAEEDAIDAAESIARGEATYADRIIFEREAPHQNTERFVVTSLEPCIGCHRRIVTHKLDQIWIGAPDPVAAVMLNDGGESLPVLWRDMTNGTLGLKEGEAPRGLEFIVPDTEDSTSPYYVDPRYVALPEQIFLSTREGIDATTSKEGLADMSRTIENAQQLLKSRNS